MKEDREQDRLAMELAALRQRIATLERSEAQLRQAEEELRTHERYLTLLNQITRAALGIPGFQAMLQTLANRLGELFRASGCHITLWDEARGIATLTVAYGAQRESYLSLRSEPGETTLTEAVLQAGHPLAIRDLSNTPYISPRLAALIPAQSLLSLPLIAGDQKLGAVCITFDHPHDFTPAEIAHGDQAAGQIALAVATARLLAAERRRSAELEALRQASLHLTSRLELQPVLEAILEHTLGLVAADDAHIFLYDGKTLRFGAALWADGHRREPERPRPRGLTYTVARNGEGIFIPNVNEHPLFEDWLWGGAIVGLPLCIGERVVGVMTIAFKGIHDFDESERRALGLLADQAAVAIENARLFAALQEAHNELEVRVAERTAELQMRNEELDAYAHTVAHDLKTPLTLIVSYAETLARCYAILPEKQVREYLDGIVRTGHKMGSITDELLVLAGLRKMEVEMRPLDMASIVSQALQRLAHVVEDYQAKILLPDTWPVALGYGPWVEEVWANYLSNALRYGGRPPWVELGSTVQADGMICFWVRDNGPGLTAEDQARLFSPHTRLDQVHATGHGLGLSIVRRIVEKLGGQVGVESEVSQGSVFTFSLPGVDHPDQV